VAVHYVRAGQKRVSEFRTIAFNLSLCTKAGERRNDVKYIKTIRRYPIFTNSRKRKRWMKAAGFGQNSALRMSRVRG
jgi:hypothetical protein